MVMVKADYSLLRTSALRGVQSPRNARWDGCQRSERARPVSRRSDGSVLRSNMVTLQGP